MDDGLLEALQAASDDQALQTLIRTHALDIETVEALKAHSAHFYFEHPAGALRIASVAYRLGLLLPDPAPTLGRWTLANALLFADRYREAADLFDRARADYLAAGHTLDAARMGVGHVWALAYTGQFERALQLAAEVEPVLAAAAATDPTDHRRLGELLNNVGILYDLLGLYEEALAAYDRKLEIARALDNELDAARAQHNRACALTYLNAFDEALAAFREAETGFLNARVTADLARLAYNRGTLYAHRERYAEAEVEFAAADEWLSTLDGTDQARVALTVYRALARLQSGARPDTALLSGLLAAQTSLAAHGPLFEEGLAWLGLGRCHVALGDLPAARHAFEQALTLAERGADRPLAWEALHYLGNLAEARSDPAAAIAFYERALTQIEAIRRDLHVETFRAGFLADKLAVYGDLALLHVRSGRLEEAFAVIERAKSRLLAERLAGRLSDEMAALPASDDPHTQALALRLRDLLVRLEQLYGQASVDEASERGETWSVAPDPGTLLAVKQLEGEVLDLVRKMERDCPLLSPLATGHAAPLHDVQARLPGTSLLQYHIARGRVWVCVVDGTGVRAYHDLALLTDVETVRRRFSAAVERALGLASGYGLETLTRYLPTLLADAQAQLSALYDLLFRPLVADLPPDALLIVSPDGPLHYVPFHALHDGTAYLVERRVLSYTPSATVLDLCAWRTATGQGMLVTGYSGERLAQVNAEVEALSGLFPAADLLREAEATAERLLACAPHYRVLHLAAHACFRADNTMLSSLSLADRRLTLAEIARLRLGAELVALSGCETGRGRLYGADLLSLACGFLGAGARSLLVSLWRVDDATTAQLMRGFYQALKRGEGRAAALRTAQLELLALGREQPADFGAYRHPAYWAPFILIGEWGRLSSLPGGADFPVCHVEQAFQPASVCQGG
jgi:tetratricopeptide (TPR) repeat protein